MRASVILYAFWSLLIAIGFVVAALYAYSPFADVHQSQGRTGYYGPNHK